MKPAAEVVRWIMAGELDDQLDAIRNAVRARHLQVEEAKKLSNAASFTPGTKVSLTGLSPKYLNGTVGTVEASDEFTPPGTLRVGFSPDIVYKRALVDHLLVPANCLRKAE